jgi:hypothetical protein
MSELSSAEKDILKAARFDGRFLLKDGAVVMIRTNVAFRGVEYQKAIKSLRGRGYLKWIAHDVEGGEIYDLTENGRAAST